MLNQALSLSLRKVDPDLFFDPLSFDEMRDLRVN